MTHTGARPDEKQPVSRGEFVALMAMLAGTVAFSIDAMLPALPDIAHATQATGNREQFIITAFVLGMGIGTLFTGPISDAVGRRKVVVAGAVVYCIAALVAAMSQSLEVILAARVVQGLGAAGPRVAALSIIRDLYAGRQMAKIVSIVMIVFALVPTIAPTLGAFIIAALSWRWVFVSFAAFSAISVIWLLLRLPETLPPERRRPFRWASIKTGTTEVFANRTVVLALIVQSLVFGILFGALSATQPMFDQAFGRADTFHLWFGGIALVSASGGFLNAAIVERLGMKLVIRAALTGLTALSILILVAGNAFDRGSDTAFGLYVLWQTAIFFSAGLTIGNLNALALEPMGHIAGLAASIVTAGATIFGALLAMPVSLLFDGTLVSTILPIALMAAAGALLMRWMPHRTD